MSLVLDPPLALSWYFEDERTSAANALLDQVADQGAIVPGLWRLEIANGLRTAYGASALTRLSGTGP